MGFFFFFFFLSWKFWHRFPEDSLAFKWLPNELLVGKKFLNLMLDRFSHPISPGNKCWSFSEVLVSEASILFKLTLCLQLILTFFFPEFFQVFQSFCSPDQPSLHIMIIIIEICFHSGWGAYWSNWKRTMLTLKKSKRIWSLRRRYWRRCTWTERGALLYLSSSNGLSTKKMTACIWMYFFVAWQHVV